MSLVGMGIGIMQSLMYEKPHVPGWATTEPPHDRSRSAANAPVPVLPGHIFSPIFFFSIASLLL